MTVTDTWSGPLRTPPQGTHPSSNAPYRPASFAPPASSRSSASSGRPAPPTDPGDQLDAILGEHVLPIRGRRPGHDEPHLLAVDASGLPTVVEVVARLDEAALMRALRHTGRAARLTTDDLAGLYPGGRERFTEHLAAFRRTVPATTLLSPWVRSGARLLLVCAEVDPAAEDVVEFLLQPAWQVEMLQIQVQDTPQGRQITGVHPVLRTPPRREAGSTPVPDLSPVPELAVRAVSPMPPRAPEPASATQASHPAPALARIGALMGEPMPLVWVRGADLGDVLEALLHVDGWIELPDGSLHPDPDSAALRAGGVAVHGRHAWRLGYEEGPTLAQAAVELGIA